MALYKLTDPMMLVALENEDKLKQSIIDQLTEENNERTMLIDQLRQDTKALTLEYERGREEQNEKECESEVRIDPETVKAMMLEAEQLRELNAALLATTREEREREAGGNNSNGKRRLCREDALLFQCKELEDSYKVLQRQMSGDSMKGGTKCAFKHSICLVKSDGGVESESDAGNDQSGSGGPDIRLLEFGLEAQTSVPVTQDPLVYNISDCILRKKCFDDEEGVDDVDEDIERLIMETYSKKVTFDEDVEEEETVEEELEAEDEEGGAGAEERDTVTAPQEVEEEEEFVSTDDEDLGDIGQFRKKTFDDEEVIHEVDSEVEMLISKTYANFTPLESPTVPSDTTEDDLHESAVSDTEVDLHVTISLPRTCNVGTQTEGVYPTGPITNTLMAPVPVLPIQSSSNFIEINSERNGHTSPSQIEGPNINWFSVCPRPPAVAQQQSAFVLGPLYRGSTPNASYYRNADLTTSAVSVIGFTQAGLPVRIATNLNLGVASTVTQTGPTSYIVYSNGVSSAVYL